MINSEVTPPNIREFNNVPEATADLSTPVAAATYAQDEMFLEFGMGESPGEFHPEALAEPYVTLSRHTAPIKEPPRILAQCANRCGARRDTVLTQHLARWTRLRSFLYFCLAHLTSS